MPTTGELSARKAAVLRDLVQLYIRTGEPVGSEALAAYSKLGVSSATIRNELGALEEMGYLTQPHTSAGRTPTELGYRYFVDMLPDRPRLRDPERRAIVHFFDEALADVDEILRGTTLLLSRLTRHAALALAPSFAQSPIARTDLIPVGTRVLLLVVFENGRVEKRILDLPSHLAAPEREVERLSRVLSEELRGVTLAAARAAAEERGRRMDDGDAQTFERVAAALASMQEAESEQVFLGGVANIAAEEAFRRRETLRGVLEALERQSEVLRLLREAAATPITVMIGRENPLTEKWEASMVVAPYGDAGRSMGTIGVVGPLRMDYVSAISAVREVAERLSAAVRALRV